MVSEKVDGQILFGARSEKPKILFGARGEKRKNLFSVKWHLRKNLFGNEKVKLPIFIISMWAIVCLQWYHYSQPIPQPNSLNSQHYLYCRKRFTICLWLAIRVKDPSVSDRKWGKKSQEQWNVLNLLIGFKVQHTADLLHKDGPHDKHCPVSDKPQVIPSIQQGAGWSQNETNTGQSSQRLGLHSTDTTVATDSRTLRKANYLIRHGLHLLSTFQKLFVVNAWTSHN